MKKDNKQQLMDYIANTYKPNTNISLNNLFEDIEKKASEFGCEVTITMPSTNAMKVEVAESN